jgi:hypothetical protein
MSLITIETTRYSVVVRKFLEHYPGEVKLDRAPVQEPSQTWCVNRRLQAAINFSLQHGGIEVLGFHDGPSNMWAHQSALPFVQQLAQEHLLRYSVSPSAPPSSPSPFRRFMQRVFGT